MRVLLVEDDADLAELVAVGLRREHLAVDHATLVSGAREHLVATDYDVVCLDLGLPDGDGLDLCREMIGGGHLRRPKRILILTALDAVADRVAGLDAGADDYLIKPFSIIELAARIRAVTRRRDVSPELVTAGSLVMDVITHQTFRHGDEIRLTSREFSVLRYLATRRGQVISSEELLEHCWDSQANPFTTSVKVIISRLRSKLGEPDLIETRRGAGYQLGDSA